MEKVAIESVLNYWDKYPCNVARTAAPPGTKDFFEEHTNFKYWLEPHILRFADFPTWQGKLVLEIGCGIGADVVQFALAGARLVTAVDISPAALELTRSRVQLYSVEEQVNLVQANAEELAMYVFPQPYDLIYCYGVLHHTPRPDLAIEQFTRYYSSGKTSLKLMLYHKWSPRGLKVSLGLGRTEFVPGCPISDLYTKNSVRKLLGRNWEVTEMRTVNYGWNLLVTACRI